MSPIPATLNSPDLSAAFQCLLGQPRRTFIRHPGCAIRVSMDQPGQVLLTNLQVSLAGSKLPPCACPPILMGRHLQLHPERRNRPGRRGHRRGDDGSIDDTWNGSPSSYPVTLTSHNLGPQSALTWPAKPATWISPSASMLLPIMR